MTLRLPPLEGALNFRDLGGYRTADGRSVRWMTLYRSGTTHAMTAADIAHLESLGIRYAYDFRSNTERRQHPSRLTEISELSYGFRDHDSIPGDIKLLLRAPGAVPEHSHRLMIALYRSLPYELEDAYRSFFRHLTEGNLPLVFNCTAGKDRTGVAAALLLSALGVPRDVVVEDYMATGQFFERSCELILTEKNMALFSRADRKLWEPLMRVHEDYVAAMFDEVCESHGSVERYLEQRLGVDETSLERIRSWLLE